MFDAQIYKDRRDALKRRFTSGILLFIGNDEAPANYSGNTYVFRQDSTLLYYFGLDVPGFSAIIDVDNNTETIFGYEFTIDDIVWMGPQSTLAERAEQCGVANSVPADKLIKTLQGLLGKGVQIHFLPQYRNDNITRLSNILGYNPDRLNSYASVKFIKSVIDQRSVKSEEEITEIETAVDIAHKMHTSAMKMIRPGIYERKIAGMIEGIALSLGSGLAFRPIVSRNGQTLHNPFYDNLLADGDLVVNDSGAETKLHYASDITRTLPVGGKFTEKQKDIYEIVLRAQMNAIEASKPGIFNKELHFIASKTIADGLIQLGLMNGSADDAVNAGAHALFFPHGLGHMMGLDVHDMENLGEDLVGYNDQLERSEQFGLKYLRLAKALQPGYVFTIEPGIYFIPQLIDMWKSESKFTEFINYDKLEEYKDFGGIRIEDDILITDDGYKVLGKPIPKKVEEIEALCSSK